MKYNKILITGATGEIGSCLVKELSCENLLNLGRNKERLEKLGNKYVQCDLNDLNQLKTNIKLFEDVDCLIHLAANVKESKNVLENGAEMIENNIFSTVNLLKFLPNLKKIIFPSSCSVYGIFSSNEKVDEKHVANPEGIYAASKLATENLLSIYAKNKGIELCILRISSVFSPKEYSLNVGRAINIFAENISQNKTIKIIGDGENKRDFIYLKDVVLAIKWSFDKTGIYNISSGKSVSVNEIVKILKNIANKEVEITHESSLFKEPNYKYISTRAKKSGFIPKYSLNEALREVYSTYLS